ncbi:MAG: methyl-accepting chemotaxis protein, partial [Rubrivivax sp.]
SQMDRVTQQNAALVEESAAAAESLKGQAHQLVQSVAVFKLSNRAAFGAGAVAVPAFPGPRDLAPVAKVSPLKTKAKLMATPVATSKSNADARLAAHAGADDWASF